MIDVSAFDEVHVVSDLHLGGQQGFRIFGSSDALVALIDRLAAIDESRAAAFPRSARLQARDQSRQPRSGMRRARDRAGKLLARTGPDAFEVFSTRRQIVRYMDGCSELAGIPAAVQATAAAIVKRLSERSDPGYDY